MFTFRFMLGAAVGAAVGYGVSRAMEAYEHKMPLSQAFKLDRLHVPIAKLSIESAPKDAWIHPVQPSASFTKEQRDQLDAWERKYPGRPLPSIRLT